MNEEEDDEEKEQEEGVMAVFTSSAEKILLTSNVFSLRYCTNARQHLRPFTSNTTS